MKTPMKNFLGSPLLSSNMLHTLFPTSIPLIRINLALYLLYDFFFLVFRFSFRLLRFFVKRHFFGNYYPNYILLLLVMPPPFPHHPFLRPLPYPFRFSPRPPSSHCRLPPRLLSLSLLPTLPLPPPNLPFFPSLYFPPLRPHLLPLFSASPSSSFSFPPSCSSFRPSTSAFPPSPSPLFPSSIASWSLFSSVLFPPPCLSSSVASLPTPSTPFPPSSRRTDRPRLRPLPPLRRPRLRLLPFSSAFSSLFLFLSQRLASSA